MEGGGAEGVTRVLLVDDSPVDRKVVELVLGSNTFAGSFHGQLPSLPWLEFSLMAAVQFSSLPPVLLLLNMCANCKA